MSSEERKLLAQTLYLSARHTQKAIAEMLAVTEKTVGKWVAAGNWEQMRQLQTVTKAELLKEAYLQLAAINKKIKDELKSIPSKVLSDAKAQILREIEALDDRSLQIYADCFEDFTAWLMQTEPAHAPVFSQLLLRFLEYKLNN
jgi:transposase